MLLAAKKEVANFLRKHGGKTGKELKAVKESILGAVSYGNIEAVKQHLAAGADVDATVEEDRTTPLHGAALNGHKEVAELLIAKGANVNAKDGFGRTPLDWAIINKYTELADLLRKHGGKTAVELKAAAK